MKKLLLFLFLIESAMLCQAANIGFLYALEKDTAALEKRGATRVRDFLVGTTTVQEFSYDSHRIFAVKMGSGVVQTCLTAQALFSRQQCDLVISVGPVGGIDDKANRGTWYRVSEVVAWQKGSQRGEQFELHKNAKQAVRHYYEEDGEPEAIQEFAEIGVASGEVFVASDSFRRDLAIQSGCSAVDMNLFGLLTAMDSHGLKGIHLRVVSDLADNEASEDFQGFAAEYDGKGGELALRIIRELPEDKSTPEAHDALRRLLQESPEAAQED